MWGILLLLLVGYVWLLAVGVGSSWVASLTAIAFGVGAALTLDEFALWLNLQDVYWDAAGPRERRRGASSSPRLLSVGIWGGPVLDATLRGASSPAIGRANLSQKPRVAVLDQ